MHPSSGQGSTDRPLPHPSRGSVSPRLEEESWEEGPGEEAPQTLGAQGRSWRGAATPGARRRGAPAQPATRRKAGTTRRMRSREGAGGAAGARRGLQVPACPAAAARLPPPLKGSGSRSRRVAAAFTLPPRLGGRELRRRRALPRPALPARGFPSEAPAGSPPQPPRGPDAEAWIERRCARRRWGRRRRAAAGGRGAAAADGGAGSAASRALQQCEQLQKLIDISIGSLRGLRTKCAVSSDLTQQEIRTLEAKLVRCICKQQQCKLCVAPGERTAELNSYPSFTDWLYTFNMRPEVVQNGKNEEIKENNYTSGYWWLTHNLTTPRKCSPSSFDLRPSTSTPTSPLHHLSEACKPRYTNA
ncbi:uncharacterized protein [Manis javanica]|uniref:uncharacterized protein n=1 Tax=Manis javanica TaxID=9974 RepID=UPI003C6D66F7